MTCDACNKAADGYPLHCPSCMYCGARLIQTILKLPRPLEERQKRARAMLDDWKKHGHSEAEIRALAKSGRPAIAPSDEPKKRGG